jgi:hypothetical protein
MPKARGAFMLVKNFEGVSQFSVHRNDATSATFRDAARQHDLGGNSPGAAHDHLPSKSRYLTCAQTGFEAQ